jgi:hypothetical protein
MKINVLFFRLSEKLFTFPVSLEARKKLLCRLMQEQSDEAAVSFAKGCVFDSSLLLMIEKERLILNLILITVAYDNAIMN